MASRVHRLCLTIHFVTSPRIAPLAIKQAITVTGNNWECAAVHTSVWSNIQWVFLKHPLCAEHHGAMTLIFPSWVCGLPGLAVCALHVITADCDCFKKVALEFGSLVHTWHIEMIAFSKPVAQSCPALRPHGLHHVRFPCHSPSPRVCSDSCPLNWWCHPTISFSVTPFSCCPQSFPASGSFPVSQLFSWSDHSIGASALIFQWIFRVDFL